MTEPINLQPTNLPPITVSPEEDPTSVSLESPTPVGEGVSIGRPEPISPPFPEDVVTSRASKIQTGVGKYIPQKDANDIADEIRAGREKTMRDIAASNVNAEMYQRKLQTLQSVAASSPRPLNEDEVNQVLDPFNPNNKPVTSDSVVEKYFSKNYIGTVQDAADSVKSVPIKEAQETMPEDLDNTMLKGSSLTFKMNFAQKLLEEYSTAVHNQSYVGWGADTLKNMFQPYVEAKMRSNVGFTSGLGLGSAIQNKADETFGLPDEAFAKQAREIGDSIAKDNPSLAVKWAEYLRGLPTTDRVLDNAFTAMTPFDYAALLKSGLKLSKAIDVNRRANIAVKQLVEAADKVGNDPVGKAEAAGDLATASTNKATENIVKDLNGSRDAVELTKEPLLTNMKLDQEKLGTNTNGLSNEGVRRIQDQYEASGTGLIQRIIDAVRVNRIPMALATKNAVNVLKGVAEDYYVGVKNAILDVSDPLYEPRSNTYWHEITFGNYDGTLFSNEKTAKNFADKNGLADVKVVSGEGDITNAKTQKLLDTKIDLEKKLSDAETGIQQFRVKMNDGKLSEADRAKAKEDLEAFGGFKKDFQKKLDETNDRLKGEGSYNHLSKLQAEADYLKGTGVQLKQSLKDLENYPLGSPQRAHMLESVEWGKGRVRELAQEINAVRQGKAEVIGGRDTIRQHGVGFKIVASRPLVETDHAVRDLMIRDHNGKLIPDAVSTSSQTGWKSLLNAAAWKIRGSDDTLAINESIQRKVATYSQSLFKEWAADEAKHIRQISTGLIRNDPVTGAPIPYWQAKPRQLWGVITREKPYTTPQGERLNMHDAFVRTLEHAREARDDAGNKGYFFQTPGELTDHYQRYFQRAPTYSEHQAYFAFVRMVEGDRILREISEFRNRARLGVEQFQLKAFKPGQPRGSNLDSGFFDARPLKEFPGGDDVMLIMAKRLGDERVVNLGGAGIDPRKLREYRDLVKQGRLRVIEIYAPEHTPLRSFSDVAGNEHIRYILTEAAESKPIEFNHVNRRGGGHFEYDYDFFLKQAKMYHQWEVSGGAKGRYRSVYTGDTTFMPLLNRAMGADISVHLHEVQRLLKANQVAAAERYTQNHLPIEWNKLHDMFKPTRDAEGKQLPPMLDLHEPFTVVPKGKTVGSMDPGLINRNGGEKLFKDASRSGSLNRQFSVAYNTERESEGLKHIMDTGTASNPVYKYSPTTKFIDPITTMNKSLNKIVQTVFMDDYKMYAVEHWLREAEDHLEPVRKSLSRYSPFWVFTSAIDKSAFRDGTPWSVIQNLLNNRFKINQFVGIPSTFDTAITQAKNDLVDWAYNKFGPEESRTLRQKAISVLPITVLSHIHDPITFMRSMTFHEKLGLFNPAQLLVQAQTYATILSIAPTHGIAGTYAALLHTWAAVNPNMLATLDRYASKMSVFGQSRWRPGEFTEANIALRRTGFKDVAGEHANLNTQLKTDFVGNSFKTFINAGTFFFQAGEKSQRLGGWYTAFREFRELNPTGAISNADIGKILQRADLLTANMSRASNGFLQSGVFSLTSQFLTYQMRLAEMMLGSRLTGMEKLRMVTFYSLLYGAPSAVGLSGLPMTNSIRSEAINRGYVLGDNWLSTAIDQGLPAVAAAWITGGMDFRKGNNYNIGARYGSPGFTQLQDALKSDHAWWQLIAGASGSTLINQFAAGSPFWHAMIWQAFGKNSEKPYPLTLDDFVGVFKEISSVNQAWKLIAAINTGKWMSKNEGYIGDVSKWNAAFMAITGLSPQQQEDAYIKGNIRKSEDEFQKSVAKEVVKELQRRYQNQKDGNLLEAAKNARKADTMMEMSGFPADRKASVMSQSLKGFESMINEKDYEFGVGRNTPDTRTMGGIPIQSDVANTRREQFRTQQQLNQYKEQK